MDGDGEYGLDWKWSRKFKGLILFKQMISKGRARRAL